MVSVIEHQRKNPKDSHISGSEHYEESRDLLGPYGRDQDITNLMMRCPTADNLVDQDTKHELERVDVEQRHENQHCIEENRITVLQAVASKENVLLIPDRH